MKTIKTLAGAITICLCSQQVMALGFGKNANTANASTSQKAAIEVGLHEEQAVTINTGNELIDAVSNMAAQCLERKTALNLCGSGFKGIACKKAVEIRYKNADCEGF